MPIPNYLSRPFLLIQMVASREILFKNTKKLNYMFSNKGKFQQNIYNIPIQIYENYFHTHQFEDLDEADNDDALG